MKFPKTRYVLRTLHHKWHVFRYGLLTGAPVWRLVIHDWTKFLPTELPAYANRFYGDNDDQLGFAFAWNHHQKSHPHHWEYFVPLTSHTLSPVPEGKALPMPEWAVREMVADWLGAERSYGGTMPETLSDFHWYIKERPSMILHEETAERVDRVLSDYFARLEAERRR